MADILVTFAPKGDDDVLAAVKKVTRQVDDLKRIAKTPIDLEIVKGSMPTEDFNRLVATVNRAKEATRDFGKEAAKASREAAKEAARAAKEADKMAASFARGLSGGGGRRGGGGGGGGGGVFNTPDAMAGPDPAAFSRGAVDKVNKDLKDLNKNLGETEKKAKGAAQGLGFVGRIIAAMAVRTFVREIYEMTNAWTAFENKIKTVLKNQEDLGFVTKDLIGISQRSRASLDAVGTIYTRTARAVQSLGKSQQETARFTETLSKAVAVGGSNSIEAKNAMIQLSQGLSSGTLKGDELRSVLEQLPIVAQLIADKMGVTVGQLRRLGSEGKLTTDVVFGAIVEATGKIEAQFAKMKPTLESVVQVIKDKFMVAIGQSSGALDMVTKALSFLSDHFDIAFRAATALAGIMATLATGKFAVWAASGLANPWILLATAVAAVTVTFVAFSDKIAASNNGVLKLSDATNAWIKTFKSDLMEIVKGLQEVVSIFTGPIKIGWDVDTMMNRLAKMTDMARVLANPGRLALAAVRDSKEDREWAGKTQRNLNRERRIAVGAEKDAFWVKQKETEQKFNAMMRDNMAAPVAPVAPFKKEHKESGKTFDELIKEAVFDENNSKWDGVEEKIRDRLHNMMEKLKPSIKKSMEDINGQIAGVNAQWKMDYSKNYEKWQLDPAAENRAKAAMEGRIAGLKKQNGQYLAQSAQLEDLVRQEMTRDFYAKQRLEEEKEAEKLLEKRIEDQKKFEALQVQRVEESADHQVSRIDRYQGLAATLDPNVGIRSQIKEMQEFETYARQNHLADWAKLATERIDELKASMRWENTHFETFAQQMTSIFGPGGTLVKGFADAAANAFVMSQSLGDLRRALVDVLNSVQKQALSSLIQLPMNLALGALTNSITGGGATSSLTSEAGGVRMLSAAEAAGVGAPKFSSGGYTGGSGVNDVAGIVHGQEYVLNADATRRMGRENLDLINKGATPVATSSSQPSAQVTVHNYAGVQVETQQLSPGQVQVMITKAIRDQAGKMIAGQINDPNSQVSRSLQKNMSAERRRI